ncbi:MAG TPA: F0F1 ATP synthase subunit alpha, partial [bacterium]|nr:F0F1 ATP synthase subunit alpha [bacterium]
MNPEPERSRVDSPLTRARAGVGRYGFGLRIAERGNVVSVGDGIAWVEGLPSAAMEQLLVFDDDTLGLTFQLSQELVGAILLQETAALTAGTGVSLTGQELSMPVGDGLLGRVIDPLGNPLDGRGATNCVRALPMQHKSPPIVQRDFVQRPLYTGNKIIDTMIPIGRGQRQLIVGDNGLGKSTLALDAVVNQKDQGVPCVLVLIGQKRSIV